MVQVHERNLSCIGLLNCLFIIPSSSKINAINDFKNPNNRLKLYVAHNWNLHGCFSFSIFSPK